MDGSNAYVETGQRRGSRIFHSGDGFYYRADNCPERFSTVYLRCIGRYRQRCFGRAILTVDNELVPTAQHCHPPDPNYAMELQLRHNILERCRARGYHPYRLILQEERAAFPLEVRARITMPRIRTSMRNARMERYPNIPATLLDLGDLLRDPQYESICSTIDGNDNIFGNQVTATDGSVSIIFASDRMLRFMARVRIIFCDGTFCNPSLPETSQVFNILTSWGWQIIPLVTCLMERRTIPAYQAIFQELKTLSPEFRPERSMTDYELALLGAIEAEFPGIDVIGCLFHFVAAVIKYAKDELGMAAFIRDNPAVKRIIQLCCAIPLAPPQYLRAALGVISEEARATIYFDDLLPFFWYLWNTWLTGRRYESLSVSGCEHRTNNICESYNRLLSSQLGPHHPNIYRFIEVLAKSEDNALTDIWTLFGGHQGSRPRRSSALANDSRIQNWTSHLNNGLITIRDFIHNVSPSVHGLVADFLQ